ncbi:hypothetical protein Pelo_1773 [Pelomyxa schiedti]|nr:hypothetical protein Pelo_1773 [Pelomyxa schiedti]
MFESLAGRLGGGRLATLCIWPRCGGSSRTLVPSRRQVVSLPKQVAGLLPPAPATIMDLPVDALDEVLCLLDGRSLAACHAVCKAWSRHLNEKDCLWSALLHRDFPGQSYEGDLFGEGSSRQTYYSLQNDAAEQRRRTRLRERKRATEKVMWWLKVGGCVSASGALSYYAPPAFALPGGKWSSIAAVPAVVALSALNRSTTIRRASVWTFFCFDTYLMSCSWQCMLGRKGVNGASIGFLYHCLMLHAATMRHFSSKARAQLLIQAVVAKLAIPVPFQTALITSQTTQKFLALLRPRLFYPLQSAAKLGSLACRMYSVFVLLRSLYRWDYKSFAVWFFSWM